MGPPVVAREVGPRGARRAAEPVEDAPRGRRVHHQAATDTPAASKGKLPFEITPFGRNFFRPELGLNLHDCDFGATDTDFIFALRTNTGVDAALRHDIHVVVDLQSYGTYTLRNAPVEPGVSLYQGYLDFVNMGGSPLDLRVGRAELERYGTGMLIVPDSFYDGFSLEQARLRYDTDRLVLNLAWHQLYALVTTAEEEEA